MRSAGIEQKKWQACPNSSFDSLVERFEISNGRFPKNLDELVPNYLPALPVDPFDGQPLRYKPLEKGCVIYSIGKDRHDDGGRERPRRAKSTDKTTCDITFTVER